MPLVGRRRKCLLGFVRQVLTAEFLGHNGVTVPEVTAILPKLGR